MIEYTVEANGVDPGSQSPAGSVLKDMLATRGLAFCDCVNTAIKIRRYTLMLFTIVSR